MKTLPDELEAIAAAVSVFDELGLPCALIGGIAVGVRSGVPRATLGVHFAIPTGTEQNTLARGLEARSFRRGGTFAHSMNFVHESGEPIQLAFDPEFDDMITRADALVLDALEGRVVTREDLLVMKRRAAADPGRRRSKALRDQADIALLEGDVPTPDEGW